METVFNLNEKDLYWIVGLLEGEGAFITGSISKNTTPGFRVSCAMTDEDVIQKLQNLVPGTYRGPIKPAKIGNKPVFYWALGRKQNCIEFAALIQPFMGIRRKQQIQVMLDYAKKFPASIKHHGIVSTYQDGCRCDECSLPQQLKWNRYAANPVKFRTKAMNNYNRKKTDK